MEVGRIDAIFVSVEDDYNTILITGNTFYMYDEFEEQMSQKGQGVQEKWNGVPLGVDAALTWQDEIVYFFKGKQRITSFYR